MHGLTLSIITLDGNLNFIRNRPERWTKEPLDATFRPAAKGPL